MQKIGLVLLFIFTLSSCSNQIQKENVFVWNNVETIEFPKPIGYVNDYALVLDSLHLETLENKLKKFDNETTNQIFVVTIDDNQITDENFDKYALDLSIYWQVGTKEKNNGLTIVFSPRLQRIRINTGLGTEKILTDKICEDVLRTCIIPEFKTSNYYSGLNKAIDELIRLWK